MKARKLRALLNGTRYTISNNDEYISVGSPMCHNLISVDKKSLKLRYALDTFHKGRESLLKDDADELLFIYDTLQELINTGEIKDIIEGRDIIENPLPVFTVRGGVLLESVTDAYGWPNTDDDGICMYNNTHFDNKADALQYGIRETECGVELYSRRVNEIEAQLADFKQKLLMEKNDLVILNELLLHEIETTEKK